jgi:hypothetical protein
MAVIAKTRLIQIDHLITAIMGIIHTSARWRKSCDPEVYLMRVCDDSDSKIVQDVAVVIG